MFHIDVLPSSCRECFVKGRHCVWAIRVSYIVLYLCSDGAPQRCQWMPLCSVGLSPHVLSLAKYLSMAFEKIHKIPVPPNYHLSCHSSVHMTHSKSPNDFPPRLFFHSFCIRSSLHSTPRCSEAPGHCCPQHPQRRPRRGAAPQRRSDRCEPPSAAV